jgi:hypothetical protein
MSWSPLQREMLEAMGLSPYRLASAMPADAPPSAETSRTTDTKHAEMTASTLRDAPAPHNALDTMTAALLRAAGFDRDVRAKEIVHGLCSAPQTLRGDPRAKRALWPQLRALRKR